MGSFFSSFSTPCFIIKNTCGSGNRNDSNVMDNPHFRISLTTCGRRYPGPKGKERDVGNGDMGGWRSLLFELCSVC
ncbi:hypothetical protein I7I53_09650 [Histoplasma capsulatum var. duboisii H88]|uniref:Uncharacterized protein n=1 Tax=Ajellomyces capsulatus (strain H88) TaxID=544711 RepID=A0A8A1L5E5_AJEC8|nr:hypothetical protein I7I53_09650 [Histoplasma capsulatum var. duboisii H88]